MKEYLIILDRLCGCGHWPIKTRLVRLSVFEWLLNVFIPAVVGALFRTTARLTSGSNVCVCVCVCVCL